MHAFQHAAIGTCALALLGSLGSNQPQIAPWIRPGPASLTASPSKTKPKIVACELGSLPTFHGCVSFEQVQMPAGPALVAQPNRHRNAQGQTQTYEQIPMLPERSPNYRHYLYPLDIKEPGIQFSSGYDLDRPEDKQRHGPQARIGHGGVDILAPTGTEVRAMDLEFQKGPAEVLYVGELFGTTVVTLHVRNEGKTPRSYVVLHGHLKEAAPGLEAGQKLELGQLLGWVGQSGHAGIPHLHLETRRVRLGKEAKKLSRSQIIDHAFTVVSDPRNVLLQGSKTEGPSKNTKPPD
jgi:murein DD-endopeptidase MepM/ murein hydrolase activator NlpD